MEIQIRNRRRKFIRSPSLKTPFSSAAVDWSTVEGRQPISVCLGESALEIRSEGIQERVIFSNPKERKIL